MCKNAEPEMPAIGQFADHMGHLSWAFEKKKMFQAAWCCLS